MFEQGHIYDQDGLRSTHNHEFMDNVDFQRAYNRGIKAAGMDYGWHWRAYTALWVAQCAAKLTGDFVECGVAKGFLSSAIMESLDWDKTGKTFYLLDTFSGLDERYVSREELADGALDHSKLLIENGIYATDANPVIANFSEWKNVEIVVGAVPETLGRVKAKKIAYLHLDMNCAPPEIAAITHFWDRLVDGAFVLMDDYAYVGYRHQKVAMDAFAASKHVTVLSMPTGQGLLMKPPGRPSRWSLFRST